MEKIIIVSFVFIAAWPNLNLPVKHENVFRALCEEGPDHLHQDLKDPRLVDKVDPSDPQGEAAGEKRGGETDLVNTQVSEARKG